MENCRRCSWVSTTYQVPVSICLPSQPWQSQDIHWWLCQDLPGVHNKLTLAIPCHSGNSLLSKPPVYQIRTSFSTRVQQKPRIQRSSHSFLDSKGDRRDGQFVMTHMTHDQLASGKLPVMWFCTVHEAQQAPYTWWAQQVASSTVMANKSCSSLADAFSLHLEAADVASYMRRERASFATRGKLWKLWTHFSHTCLEEMMTKYDTTKY